MIVDGFCLGGALQWYGRHAEVLRERLPARRWSPIPFEIRRDRRNPKKVFVQLGEAAMAGLWRLFPKTARDRSLLAHVSWSATHWFKRDSTACPPQLTVDLVEARAVDACCVAAFYEGSDAEIILFHLSKERCPAFLLPIVHSYAFVRAVARSIIASDWETECVDLPDGESMEGRRLLADLAMIAQAHSPISFYAAACREQATFGFDVGASDEELAENVTARLLGFTFCGDDVRGLDPFVDRPIVAARIDRYLAAKRVR